VAGLSSKNTALRLAVWVMSFRVTSYIAAWVVSFGLECDT